MSKEASNPLIDLSELSKPAVVLVEKISEGIGGIAAPWQIERVAKAKIEAAHSAAEIARIEAHSEIEVADLRQRAEQRRIEEDTRHQKNMEDITAKAIPHLNEDAKPDAMEDDWVTNFFDKSRIVSDSEMQSLWSRVLAGEANVPGTYSKRTVNLLSDLDKSDAELFTKLCGFGWMIGDVVPLVFDIRAEIYNRHGINLSTLSHLESIGLVRRLTTLVSNGLICPKNVLCTTMTNPCPWRCLMMPIMCLVLDMCFSQKLDRNLHRYVEARLWMVSMNM